MLDSDLFAQKWLFGCCAFVHQALIFREKNKVTEFFFVCLEQELSLNQCILWIISVIKLNNKVFFVVAL